MEIPFYMAVRAKNLSGIKTKGFHIKNLYLDNYSFYSTNIEKNSSSTLLESSIFPIEPGLHFIVIMNFDMTVINGIYFGQLSSNFQQQNHFQQIYQNDFNYRLIMYYQNANQCSISFKSPTNNENVKLPSAKTFVMMRAPFYFHTYEYNQSSTSTNSAIYGIDIENFKGNTSFIENTNKIPFIRIDKVVSSKNRNNIFEYNHFYIVDIKDKTNVSSGGKYMFYFNNKNSYLTSATYIGDTTNSDELKISFREGKPSLIYLIDGTELDSKNIIATYYDMHFSIEDIVYNLPVE